MKVGQTFLERKMIEEVVMVMQKSTMAGLTVLLAGWINVFFEDIAFFVIIAIAVALYEISRDEES